MTAAVETMAYAGATPWHGLGNKVEGLAPAEMLVAAGLDWTVSKRPLYFKANGGRKQVDDWYALSRDTDDQFLTLCGKKYKPIQNADVLDFFESYCREGGTQMETAGSLWDGRYIWALAKVDGGFDLGKGSHDHINNYLLISQPHVIGKSCIIKWTGVRVVCWNTLCQALGVTSLGKQLGEFRVPHSIEFNAEVKENAKEALNFAKQHGKEFQQAANTLSRKRAKAEDVDAFFGAVIRYDASKVLTTASGREKAPPRMLGYLKDALVNAPGAHYKSAEGTWWGAFNAVTYVVDHVVGNKRDTALRSAWLGPNANMKADALKLAMEMAR